MADSFASEQQAKIFAALSDPVRLRIVRELTAGGEQSGTAIADAVGISLSLLCHHTRLLSECGVLTKRKEGQIALYRLDRKLLRSCMSALLSRT